MNTKITDARLGPLEFEDGCADTTVKHREAVVPVDVNFEGDPDARVLAVPAALVADVAKLDVEARKALAADLRSGDPDGATPLYRSHHFEELDNEVLESLFGTDSATGLSDQAFLEAFRLVRIGVYPEEADAAVLCDYSLGEELTDYLLSVAFGTGGVVQNVSMES